MRALLVVVSTAIVFLAGAVALAAEPKLGVMVMAHGGGPEWEQAVLDAVEPLVPDVPLEVAFGMADAGELQRAVEVLERRGVRRVAVVRLFVSGESWLKVTEQILGLVSGAPWEDETVAHDSGHGGHGGQPTPFFRITTESRFALSQQGLAEAEEIGAIVAGRAVGLSRDPEREDVLILAHGPCDDERNQRWLTAIEARAVRVRRVLPFHSVEVETLREDCEVKRVTAEQRVRAFVEDATEAGRAALVIPFRVFGFGPYDEVLEGLDYVADRTGFLPHVEVTTWIRRQLETLQDGPWRRPLE